MSEHVRVGVAVVIIRDGKILLGERIGSHGANTWATRWQTTVRTSSQKPKCQKNHSSSPSAFAQKMRQIDKLSDIAF